MADKEERDLCLQCGNPVKIPDKGIQCTGKCEQIFHYDCLELTRSKQKTLRKDQEKWQCYNCNPASVINKSAGTTPPTKTDDHNNTDKLDRKLDDILNRMINMEKYMNKIDDIDIRLMKLEKKMEKIEARGENPILQEEGSSSLVKDNDNLREEIKQIKWKLNHQDQQLLGDQFVIDGIPEKSNENLQQLTVKICKLFKQDGNDPDILHATDILSISRMKPKSYSEAVTSTATRRPPPILVQVKSVNLRNLILASKKNYRPMLLPNQVEDLDPDGKQIYLNPMLTRDNKELLIHARKVLKNRENPKYRFVWYKDGKILARKDSDSKTVWCRDKETVDKLV